MLTNYVTNMIIIKVKIVPLELGQAQSYKYITDKVIVGTFVSKDKDSNFTTVNINLLPCPIIQIFYSTLI